MPVSETPGLREAGISWLIERSRNGEVPLTRDEIREFSFAGHPFSLQSAMNGIRKPRGFDAALSVWTAYRELGQRRPYEDEIGPDGFIRYAWRGTDASHPENKGLRVAMELRLPIVWFVGVGGKPPKYQVVTPVYVIGEEPEAHRFIMTPAEDAELLPDRVSGTPIEESMRKYQSRVTLQRLHQPVFRSTVLVAYENRCAVCNLAHAQLLDAAHIVPDGHEMGVASVVNGLALCKIHHAAFDSYFLGVRPDLTVEIRRDLLWEVDGPMLKHGLQDLHGKKLMMLPRSRASQPKRDLLELKYEMFRSATASDLV